MLVDALEGHYHNAVLCGAADAARERGASLICFAGGMLDTPHRFHGPRNVIYDMVGADTIDGLVMMSGTMGNYVSAQQLAAFCERFAPLPMCSISVRLAQLSSVLVDNATGMRQAVEHLVSVHGKQRIAFIRGPERNEEAERRFSVYQAVIAEHGLALGAEYVVSGDFRASGGVDAVSVLLDDRRLPIDALVFSNDYMALAAIEALRRRGVRVPEQIAVVGFDDVEDARFSTPTLTTVRQPIYELGRQALLAVLEQLDGSGGPQQVTLHTELVVRRSCGCSDASAQRPISFRQAAGAAPAPGLSEARLQAAQLAVSRTLRGQLDGSAISGLTAAFALDLNDDGTRFVQAVESLLTSEAAPLRDASVWLDVIGAMRDVLEPDLPVASAGRAEELWHGARIGAALMGERLQARQRLLVQQWATTLSETTAALVTTFDVAGLLAVIDEQFPRLGIDACYVALHESGAAQKQARLLLAYDRQRQVDAADLGAFDVREIVPGLLERWHRPRTWIVEPLSFKEDQLGYAVFEMGPRDGSIYEALRDQLSGALKGALLVQQVVEQDRERQRLMEDSERRAAELELAYRALQQNQEKLVTAERMAALGRLTANIAHEISTPLAAVRAALVNLQKLIREYELSYRDAGVSAQDHAEIAGEMREELRIADSAAERAAQFVRGIKTQTRMTDGDKVVFNAVPYVREALSLLTHALGKANCRSVFEVGSDQIEVRGSPGRLAQVVTNLVANAMDASSERGGGDITIRLEQSAGAVELTVADQGSGIAPEHVSQIFEPLFTTKPFGQGTGLGLAIVKDIVTADLGGAITVESEVGRGTTFVVRLPPVRAEGGAPRVEPIRS